MSLPTWEKLLPLRRNYLRFLAPDGTTDDVYRGDLEAALEARDTPHQIFTPKDWEAFLQGQRKIASEWDLRHTFTDSDRAFLAELKIAWEPISMRARRYPLHIPSGHALVRTSDGILWHLPTVNVPKAKQRDPRLQVLHVEHWRN